MRGYGIHSEVWNTLLPDARLWWRWWYVCFKAFILSFHCLTLLMLRECSIFDGIPSLTYLPYYQPPYLSSIVTPCNSLEGPIFSQHLLESMFSLVHDCHLVFFQSMLIQSYSFLCGTLDLHLFPTLLASLPFAVNWSLASSSLPLMARNAVA